jgi:prepilin-type N-terminal cleavage/methylation domain-containing protein
MGTYRTCRGGAGFTLIELSIVLVIIGLIVGGVLMGQDLIRAAGVRATIAQIERYKTAVNTFKNKYGYLPGDIKDPDASNFGFMARGLYGGEGDGNGVIEGITGNCGGCNEGQSQSGENTMFWVDLSAARLIDGGFTTASPTVLSNGSPDLFLPPAKIGRGNYLTVWSGGPSANAGNSNGINYLCIAGGTFINGGNVSIFNSSPMLTVQEAYSIDRKIDDGLPQSGNVTAEYVSNGWGFWGTWAGAASGTNGPTTAATPGSATTCYDNGNTGGTPQQYSVEISNGGNVNCALSFQF